MKKKISILLLLTMCFILGISYKVYGEVYKDDIDIMKMKQDLFVLMLAYPEQIVDLECIDNKIYIIMKNNAKILYNDEKNKMYEDKFVNGDIEDSLFQSYPLEMIDKVMDNADPGRIRCYSLLNSMYGSNEIEIERNLKSISTYYGNITFTTVNSAAEKLQIALNNIAKFSEGNNKIYEYVAPLSGGYNFRRIQDTGVLSPHAYGIAVDLNRNDADYWKWVTKEKGSERIKSYPSEIVTAFEEQGFVWGGKWSHFDILHFEYRPEIILKAQYFGDKDIEKYKNWYDSIELNDETERLIKFIDNKIT